MLFCKLVALGSSMVIARVAYSLALRRDAPRSMLGHAREAPIRSRRAIHAHLARSDPMQDCTIRMDELGIPIDKNGAPDFDHDGKWRAFDPDGRSGGNITSGVFL